jgi:hypothetical protein
MRAYFNRMPTLAWVGVLIPVLLVGRALILAVGPAVVRALVPQTVQAVLQLL